jgi:Tfp pilus tip-associated adhesin PilY1
MAAIAAADLTGLTYPAPAYTGSTATNIEGRADEIVQNVRGCVFGTGVSTNVSTPSACTPRSWLLGDIFHSNPVVVGSPAAFLSEPSYTAFASNATQATRKRVIYAGANDGFMRGFDAGTYQAAASPPGYDRGTGTELFGFMPWPVRQKIKELPLKTSRKGFYLVDGSPAVADVWFYPTATTTTKDISGSEWKTALIGGLRQGGKGYYALDITNPAAGSYPGYLWEYPLEGDATALGALGESWSEPIITKVHVQISGQKYERWVAIVSGGYDVSGDPNNTGYDASANPGAPGYVENAKPGRGRGIFMIDIATGRLLAKKVVGTEAGEEPGMFYSIASTPAVLDLDSDGFADVIYVGDLGGNMWKWVVTAAGDDPINSIANVTQPNWPFKKFFTTPGVVVGSSTYYKSVFYPPLATFVGKQLWLAWGTGERTNLRFGDPAPASTTDNNRLYVMSDSDPYERLVPAKATLTESDLGLPQSSTVGNSCTSCAPPSGKSGYSIVAKDSEKFVTNVEIFSGHIFAGAFTPASTTDPCNSGGEAALYEIAGIQCGSGGFPSDLSPTPTRMTLGAGMPTDPRITISSDGGEASSNRVIVSKQQGDISNIEAPPIPSGGAGVLYWRERP